MFTQVLGLCQKGGLVKLGHVALDGTKVKANASKHKAMSYGRMKKKASELEAEVKRLLAQAEATDAAEDALYGKGNRGDEPAEGWAFGKGRLEKIRAAMAELEAEAQAEYADKQATYEDKLKKRKHRKRPGKKPKPPSKEPEAKRQRNFTDPDSRIMVSGGTFVQAYNCQAAVDEKAQIILAADVTQDRQRQKSDGIHGTADQDPYGPKPKMSYRGFRILQSTPDRASPRRHRYLHRHPKTQAHRPHPQVSTWPHTQKRNAQGKNGQKATYNQGSMHLRKEKAYR